MARTILVVDDEEYISQYVCRVLEFAGYRVLTARDGQSALYLCAQEEQPIDLLVTDFNMPEMDGWELAKCVVDCRPGLPVLFMTGNRADVGLKQKLTWDPDRNGREVVSKPFVPRVLTEAVKRLLPG